MLQRILRVFFQVLIYLLSYALMSALNNLYYPIDWQWNFLAGYLIAWLIFGVFEEMFK